MSAKQIALLSLFAAACTEATPAKAQPMELFDLPDLGVGIEATHEPPEPILLAHDGRAAVEVAIAPALVEPPEPDEVEILVRYGESLYDLARWSGLQVEDIEDGNDIDVNEPLQHGQPLVLPIDELAAATLEKRREGFAERRQKRYLKRRGGLVEVKSHRVRTNDSAWIIARDNGRMPLWLLAAYNPGRDLDRLSIGDTLKVPVTGDAVPAKPVASR